MIDTLIPYLNGLVDSLNLFDTTYELTDIVTIDQERSAPGVYCENGEYHSPDFEKNVLFHIRADEVDREENISEIYCGTDVTEEHKMSLIAVFSKDTIKDDKYVSSKIAQNITNVIGNQTNVSIRKSLGLYSWRISVTGWTDNVEQVWSDVFPGFDFRMDSEIGMIRIDYSFELFGPIKCFTTYNCDGSDTPIDVEQAIKDKYCTDECPDCPECPTIESLGLFKTGQVTSYDDAGNVDAGVKDDGFYEHGYGTDFFTLGPKEGPNSDGLNAFGTNHRFTDEDGNYYADPYVNSNTGGFSSDYFIDHRTRLGWFDNLFLAGGSFETIITAIDGSTENLGSLGNKSDWFLPNYLQQVSLMRFEPGLHTGWYPFASAGVGANKIANSNSAVNGSAVSYYFRFSEGRMLYEAKGTTKNYLKCRFHYDGNWNVL